MAFLLTNVSGGNIVIDDLGARTFVSATTDFDLSVEYTDEEIRNSASLGVLLGAGDITAKDTTYEVAPGKAITTAAELLLFGLKQDSDDILEGTSNLYYTDGAARSAISIATGSTSFLGYNSGTGELSVSALAITSVDVFPAYSSLALFVAGEYTVGDEFQEGDVIILPNATGGTETYIQNGGVAGTVADYTLIQQPNVDQATVRGWFSGNAPINYNSTTGVISLDYDNATILTNSAGEIYVDETVLTIATSQITNFGADVSTEVFDAANFVDGTTVDFTVSAGASITAEVALGSLDETYLSIGSPSAGANGEILASDGAGGFEWVAAGGTGTITEVVAGSGLTGGGTSGSVTLDIGAGTAISVGLNDISVLFDNATILTNSAGELYVDETVLTIATSQITNFAADVSTEVFDAANFVDGTTVDFTVSAGSSVTAEVAIGSIDETHLTIASPSTGADGETLASDGVGGFKWTPVVTEAKKTFSWGASSRAASNTNRYLDRHDGVSTNQSPYVAFFNCTLTAISLATQSASTWTAEVYVNGLSVATLASAGSQFAQTAALNIAINAGDRVAFYVNGAAVNRPSIDALFTEA